MGLVAAVDEIAGELYGVDPDAFVAARTAAVAGAKAAGDKALAREVATLRKPTRSAWLLNLLTRTQPERLAVLPELGARLAAATAALDVTAVRAAARERATVVGDLTGLAVEAGRRAGYDGGEAVRTEVATTLQAALADPEVLAALMAGRLEKAQVYAGFFGPMAPVAPATPPATTDPGVPVAPGSGGSGAPADTRPPPADGEADGPSAAAPVPDPRLVEAARHHLERARVTFDAAVAERLRAVEADEAARAALDRASQEVADLRGELRSAEQAELAARDAGTASAVDLHDARTAEQQAAAMLEKARRALADATRVGPA